MSASRLNPADAVLNVQAAKVRTIARRDVPTIAHDAGFYPSKLAECEAYGAAHGFPTDAVAGAVAAFSPGFDPTNDQAGLDWVRVIGPDAIPGPDNRPAGIAVPYGYTAWVLAHSILWGRVIGADVLKRNVKRGEYLRAILGDTTAWVIDVHCWRDMIGAPDRAAIKLGDFEPGGKGRGIGPAEYRRYRDAMVAARIGSTDQAIIWGDRRREGRATK